MLVDTQLDEFLASQPGQRAMQEHQQEQAGKRKIIADDLADLKDRRAAELSPLEDAADAAMVACEQARQTFQQAEQHRRYTEAQRNKVRSSYATQVRSMESQLVRTAPPEIDAFVDEMQAEIERMLKSGVLVSHDGTLSNRVSFEARTAALRRTIADAEKLRTQVIDGLPLRLERMRSAIPELSLVPVSSDR